MVQLCCYFVVSSLVHSLSIHLQKNGARLLIARNTYQNLTARLQQGWGTPDVSQWDLKYPLRDYKIPYEASEEACEDIESYIKSALRLASNPKCESYAVNATREHTKVFYNAGTMGMGKTRLHHELCSGMKIDCGDDVSTKFARFTYNGNTNFVNDGTGLTFIKQLLQYHGLKKVEADKTRTLEAGFDIFIQKLSEHSAFAHTSTKVLGVCIDELHLGHNEVTHQESLIKALMQHQDETLSDSEGVRVIFLFTSLTETLFAQGMANSGRTPVHPPGRVPQLKPGIVEKLLFEHFPDIKKQYDCNPFVEQLVNLSRDIPRAAFEALPEALKDFTDNIEGKKLPSSRILCTSLDS